MKLSKYYCVFHKVFPHRATFFSLSEAIAISKLETHSSKSIFVTYVLTICSYISSRWHFLFYSLFVIASIIIIFVPIYVNVYLPCSRLTWVLLSKIFIRIKFARLKNIFRFSSAFHVSLSAHFITHLKCCILHNNIIMMKNYQQINNASFHLFLSSIYKGKNVRNFMIMLMIFFEVEVNDC